MELREMYGFIKVCNEDFLKALQIKNEKNRQRMIGKIVTATIEECGSEFEEQTIIENFREVYQEFTKAIPA